MEEAKHKEIDSYRFDPREHHDQKQSRLQTKDSADKEQIKI
jgi:hypothetical protein